VSQRADSRFWIAPVLWAAVITALLSAGLAQLSWPFVDLYNNFYNATSMSWGETIRYAFGGGLEYRPLLIIGVKLAHQLAGLRVWFYQTLVIVQLAAILGSLLWIFGATTPTRAAAACIALACVIGLHTSRVLLMFAPLNAHSFGVLLLLAAIVLALSTSSRVNEWLFLPLTLFALLLLESGGLIVAVTLVLWRMKAPGATGRAVLGTLVAAAVYLAIRFGVGAQVAASTYTETGLGFEDVGAERLAEIFRAAPWLLWVYNVVASFLTVAASEPRAGKYLFVASLLHGHVPVWMYIHVISSLLTSGLIVYAWRTSRISDPADRAIAAAGVTLVLLGSALGFLYTRDRIAVSAGIGYAMLVYVALAVILEDLKGPPVSAEATAPKEGPHLPDGTEGRLLPGGTRRPSRSVTGFVTVCVTLIAIGWVIRTGECYAQLRDAGWENHQEWTTRYESLGGYTRPQTDVLAILRSGALAHVPDDPRDDPAWTYLLFEREYERTAD
jgi:hypothetical protein